MEKTVTLAHGAGGLETALLVKELVKLFAIKNTPGGTGLRELEDSALIPLGEYYLAVTADSYTVNPIFFPGGNIGKLAATGTINDLAVMGAEPLAMLDTVVVEEGFPLEDLSKIMNSMARVLEEEKVALVGGDVKVMPKGALDKIVITTMGLGLVEKNRIVRNSGLKPGDVIIINGTVGDHGAVIMACQAGIEVETSLVSDCAPVTKAMRIALEVGGVHAAKDPTRGGLAMALNDLAKKSGVSILVYEEKLPIREEVVAYCEMLGVDPLTLACEGRVVLGVDREVAAEIVEALREKGYREATVIGEVIEGRVPRVYMRTKIGGTRIVEEPRGEIVPRIC